MSEKLGLFLFSWILSWGLTAVKQLSITYDYVVNDNVIVSTDKPNPKPVDNNNSIYSPDQQIINEDTRQTDEKST